LPSAVPHQKVFCRKHTFCKGPNNYSDGRDQEGRGSKPAQANSSQDPISKKLITKRAGGVAPDVDPEFKP
jgi:hypothetical protein